MSQVQINSLEELERFISDESISLDNRLAVFTNALKEYELWIMEIKNGAGGKIEEPERVISEMLRVIKELQADPEKFIAGFVFTRQTI